MDQSPHMLADHLTKLGLRRACFIYDEGSKRVVASHDSLQDIADALMADARDFDEHEGVFIEIGPHGGLLTAALHKTKRGQGAGGVRYWPYATVADLLRDGLRLARGMGRKNALAGLWWGGGKGVVSRGASDPIHDRSFRDQLYEAYGRFVTSLQGAYVSAEDAGTGPEDMAAVFRGTRFTTCIPASVGGSGNPSIATAKGVVQAMAGALDELGLGGLAGKSVAMQGVGHVGGPMVRDLLEAGVARIIGVDIDERSLEEARQHYGADDPRVTLKRVDAGDVSIFEENVDVFTPNALGGILHETTIAKLRCKIVCGAANNQLLDDHVDDVRLHDRGIVYVADYLANRMGIVNCSNEQYGSLTDDPAITRHLGREWEHAVYNVTRRVISEANRTGSPSARAANQLADDAMKQPHPIWGHRTRAIITELRSGWAAQGAPATNNNHG